MYGCDNWTIKKVEHGRIEAFILWCFGKVWRVPWTAKKSNQSILKKIIPEYSLEGLKLNLKLQYCDHLRRRADSLEKTLMLGRLRAGGEGDNRGWDGWMASSTQWTWVWANSRRQWRTGRPSMVQSMGWKLGHDLVTEEEEMVLDSEWVLNSMTDVFIRERWRRSRCRHTDMQGKRPLDDRGRSWWVLQ